MINEIKIHPNFIQLHTGKLTGLFWNHYVYIDMPGYSIDDVLCESEYFVPVKFIKGDFKHPDKPYLFCFLKCRPKHSKELTKYIFPALHKKLEHKYGEDYLDFCAECANQLIQNFEDMGKEGDPIEIFSKCDAE